MGGSISLWRQRHRRPFAASQPTAAHKNAHLAAQVAARLLCVGLQGMPQRVAQHAASVGHLATSVSQGWWAWGRIHLFDRCMAVFPLARALACMCNCACSGPRASPDPGVQAGHVHASQATIKGQRANGRGRWCTERSGGERPLLPWCRASGPGPGPPRPCARPPWRAAVLCCCAVLRLLPRGCWVASRACANRCV